MLLSAGLPCSAACINPAQLTSRLSRFRLLPGKLQHHVLWDAFLLQRLARALLLRRLCGHRRTPAMYRFLAHLSLTWVDGNADVRSVSWVSSMGRRRGTLSTKAA